MTDNKDMDKKGTVSRKDGDYSYVSLVVPVELKKKMDEYCVEHKTSITKFITGAVKDVVDGNVVQVRDQTSMTPELRGKMESLESKMDIIIKLLAK